MSTITSAYRIFLIIHGEKLLCFCRLLCNRESFLANFCKWIQWKLVTVNISLWNGGKDVKQWKFFTTNDKQYTVANIYSYQPPCMEMLVYKTLNKAKINYWYTLKWAMTLFRMLPPPCVMSHLFLFSIVIMLPQSDYCWNCWIITAVNFCRLFVLIFLFQIWHYVDHQD